MDTTNDFTRLGTATLDEMIAQGELAAKEKERRKARAGVRMLEVFDTGDFLDLGARYTGYAATVSKDNCIRVGIDPAHLAKCAALSLCMADWLLRFGKRPINSALEFDGDLCRQLAWLCAELRGNHEGVIDRDKCVAAARAAGWILAEAEVDRDSA